MGVTRGDPARLENCTREGLARVAWSRDVLADYQDAVTAFNAQPNDLGLALPDRTDQISANLDDLALLDEQPARFAEALRDADRDQDGGRGGGSWLVDAGKIAALSYRGLSSLESAYGAGRQLARTGVNWGRYATRNALLALQERRLPRMADFARSGPLADLPRSQRRALYLEARRQARRDHRQAIRATTGAREAVRTNRPVTGIGQRLAGRFPRATSALVKGSRLLARTTVAVSAVQAVYRGAQGDWGGMASSIAGGVGTVLLLSGVGTPVGAVLVAGSLVYEFRGEIGAGLGWARDKLGGLFG